MNRNLFPLGKAYGNAFCNRIEETALLVSNIHSNKHTLLIAPRRFGKSSLAEKAIEAAKLPSIKTNFHLCTNAEEVTNLITHCVTSLISQTIGKIHTVLPSLQKFLKTLHPRISFYKDIATLELISEQTKNYAVIIAEALDMLDKLLGEKKKKAVLFFDEFQEIANISDTYAIEGAIRTAAQEFQNLSMIFSGSMRSLLLKMFEDDNRPLYKLCRKIHLRRISAEDYSQHIQNIAKKTWGKVLADSTLTKIFTLSNRHPYYVNYLCDSLWQIADSVLPQEKDVDKAWACVVAEEWSDAIREISSLPLSQRRVIRFIAESDETKLLGREASMQLKLSVSSIASALAALTEKDYLERREDNSYEIINPLLATALRQVTN